MGCANEPDLSKLDPALAQKVALKDLEIVDCIVPGSVMQMGRGMVYQTPPRLGRTTALQCGRAGGSFKLYDPANPQATIDRWTDAAESGDLDAQNYLGLLYEGALGTPPDYQKAAYWYRRAAEAGQKEAQHNLGALYEKGLGVEKDVLKAINWYRKSTGLGADALVLSSEARAELDAVRQEMNGAIQSMRSQRDALDQQVQELRSRLKGEEGDQAAADRLKSLESLLAQVQSQLAEKQAASSALPAAAPDQQPPISDWSFIADLQAQWLGDMELGKNIALIIGVTSYPRLDEQLATTENDVRAIAGLLQSKYGFGVKLLLNPGNDEVRRAISELTMAAGESDNILIYFAGRGSMRPRSNGGRPAGFWLPTDADPESDANWLSNQWVTDHLDASKARRALVIADSCYGDLLSSDGSMPPRLASPSEDTMKRRLALKSRFVLDTGSDTPIRGSSEAPHSVFTQALMEALESNAGTILVSQLYGRVLERLDQAEVALPPGEVPELTPIKAAGGLREGDFVFVASPAKVAARVQNSYLTPPVYTELATCCSPST